MIDYDYKDILSVRNMFENMSTSRIQRAMLYRESLAMASIILGKQFARESEAIEALAKYFEEPAVCDCPEPRDRRWHKVDRGEPITVSYDDRDSRVPGFAMDYLRTVIQRIEAVCAARFLEVDSALPNIDIAVTWKALPNNVLGSTFVPGTGDRMAACGPLCGDIQMSTIVDWSNIGRYITVLEHEMYHALGVPHSPHRDSIMWPSYQGVRRASIHDIRSLLDRYPPKEPIV